ncbi:universal stress protein [Pontibacterium granulatum]|uniref:universal stress protein n=1 Tax=Pontibacterium granulatum TaxID=2036029 RepID=UPI00249A6F78|nr:universal stress protein [Pontibacterium granulatum]MDI3323459.1 universal stress protein [Pontibacterium granulatum]
MLFSKRILVILDSGEHSPKALHRAQLIAERMGCELELLWVGKSEPWTGLAQDLAVLQSSAVRFTQEVITKDLIDLVVERWQQDHFALLVKGCDLRHNNRRLLAPRDWQLLRETPCPVLLVKQDQHWADGRILAAVNTVTHDPQLRAHNQSILMLAGFIAHALNAPLHAAVATPMAMQGVEPELQSQVLIDQRAQRCAENVLSEMNLRVAQLHVGEGPPEHWIPHVSTEIDASLVVMGTLARKGVSAALLGNTAERILDRLNTDILVLRAGIDQPLPPLMT